MQRRLILAVTMLGASAICIHSQAAQIQYSWSGQLVPNDVNDPWLLGPAGSTFDLSVAVTAAANDIEQNVDVAVFNVEIASLSLDGQPVPYVANGFLEFDDNWSGLVDFMVFGGEFTHLGHTLEIDSLVVFPTTTYQFTQIAEPPPFFASTANIDRAIHGGRAYAAVVPTGNLVAVVPEPGSLLVVSIGVLSFVGRCARHRQTLMAEFRK